MRDFDQFVLGFLIIFCLAFGIDGHTQDIVSDVNVEVYVDDDYLIVHVPAAEPITVSLNGLGFLYMQDDQQIVFRLADTTANDDWDELGNLSEVNAPICMVYRRVGTRPLLPNACRRLPDPESNILFADRTDSEIWWYDNRVGTKTGFRLGNGISEFGLCGAGQPLCEYNFIPQTNERLIFTANLQGTANCDLYSYNVDSDGAALQPIADETADERIAAVSNRGSRVGYVSTTDQLDRLFVQSTTANEDNRTLVLSTAPRMIRALAWTVDGLDLTYVIQNADTVQTIHLATILNDGSVQTHIIADVSITRNLALVNALTWQSERQLLIATENGLSELRLNDDGSTTMITLNIANIMDPKSSQSGKDLIFIQQINGNSEVVIGSQVGESMQLQQLTYSEQAERTPVWSPDGEETAYILGDAQIAIQRTNDPDGKPNVIDITGLSYICNLVDWVG